VSGDGVVDDGTGDRWFFATYLATKVCHQPHISASVPARFAVHITTNLEINPFLYEIVPRSGIYTADHKFAIFQTPLDFTVSADKVYRT
jgi:hypothetical protein